MGLHSPQQYLSNPGVIHQECALVNNPGWDLVFQIQFPVEISPQCDNEGNMPPDSSFGLLEFIDDFQTKHACMMQTYTSQEQK